MNSRFKTDSTVISAWKSQGLFGRPPGSETGSRETEPPVQRRGSVLLIMLVIVVLLALSVYTFTELALAEFEATSMFGRGVQSRSLADSGIEMALTVLSHESEYAGESFFHRPDLFQGVLIKDAAAARGRGRFSLVVPLEHDTTFRSVRSGLLDESAKWNLNALEKLQLDTTQGQKLLSSLPGMTPELADALLDWLDKDHKPRFQGAEEDYYLALPGPYVPANGPVASLDELLLVRGVTPRLLYGEDANRNGLIEPGEEDGDGVAQLGWNSFLTVEGHESNLRGDGTKKIDLNDKSLLNLYDQLETDFNSETAKFVIGFRMSGDRNAKNDNQNSSPQTNGPSNQANSSGSQTGQSGSDSSASNENSSATTGSDSTSGSPSTSDGGNSNGSTGSQSQQGTSPNGDQSRQNQNGPPTRGGIDLSPGAKITINSIYDLVDAEVEVTIDGEKTVLESPWSSEPGAIRQYLPELVDAVSTTGEESIEGRININQARREVLLGIPEMTEQLAEAIVQAAPVGGQSEPVAEMFDSRSTTGWLLAEGLVTLDQMRKLDRYITTRGAVYRFQSVGFFEVGGPASRLEAVIDASQQPPVIRSVSDLSELGHGYSIEKLLGLENQR